MNTSAQTPVTPPRGDDWLAICNGRAEAVDFLQRWHRYCHAIDDVVDQGYSAPAFLGVLAQAIDVYSHPFYVQYAQVLRITAVTVTSAYANSVEWEKDPVGWRFRIADVLRFASIQMDEAVATICGGYEHMRRFSPVIWDFCWQRQHTEQGEPH